MRTICIYKEHTMMRRSSTQIKSSPQSKPSQQSRSSPQTRILPILLALVLTLTACGSAGASTPGTNPQPADSAQASAAVENTQAAQPLTVITTLFPQYDFVRIIAGDRVDARLILPPGIEPHTFEPTPKDIVAIGKADLFIYTGDVMEPWAGRILEGIQDTGLQVIDASAGIDLVQPGADSPAETGSSGDDHDGDTHDGDAHDEVEHDEEAHDADAHAEGSDPHIWLDPMLAIEMVRNITDGLVAADPDHAAHYRDNADAYIAELKAFDAACQETFGHVDNRTIVYGGHFAFGYFARRYGLTHVSPYTGFSPDAEPTPRKIAELIDRIRELGTSTVYFEELVDPKVAEVIADATDAEMLLLHGAHNVTAAELKAGVSYLGIMQENLEKLKKGLGYHE
jgi:zinc transport system substrate-binding protein